MYIHHCIVLYLLALARSERIGSKNYVYNKRKIVLRAAPRRVKYWIFCVVPEGLGYMRT